MILACLACLPAFAGDLPAGIQAKFIKVLANSANTGGRIACKHPDLLPELAKIGVAVDQGSRVAWASSEAEIKALKGAGKLVICGKLEWLGAGAAIALVEEGGKPQIYFQMANLAASGVTLPDAVLKVGKRI
jgi:hypothetical protein